MEVIQLDKMKESLITTTAVKTMQSQEVVDKVINFEFKEARDALKIYGEVEISGFGKFIVSQAKLARKLRMQLDIEAAYIKKIEREGDEMSSRKKEDLIIRLSKTRDTITYLKTKLL
jgi:nucleoid DNA-binding protein